MKKDVRHKIKDIRHKKKMTICSMKKNILLFTIAINLTAICFAQYPKRVYIDDNTRAVREHPLDMQHLRLEVSFEPQKGLVKGKVTHFFTPLWQKVDSFFLDGPGIIIKEAKLNGKNIRYQNSTEGITFYPDKPLTWGSKDSLSITYEAYPKKGIYFIGWNDPKNISRKQIWTQGQGIDNRHWIPCYDELNDKLTTETIITFDSKYKVLSNGRKLAERKNKDGTTTWHYRMTYPHTTYLIMIAIGEYDVQTSKSKNGVIINNWYYPDWKNRNEATFRYTEQMMDFFENEIGVPFPWEQYSQVPVQDFMYGAMENTTATVFGDFSCVDERAFLDKNYVGTNAHELAHQWFGDLITAWNPPHHWLQESFATYYSLLFEREVFGNDYFDWGRRNAINAALNASKNDLYPIAHSLGGTTRHYPKGAIVLDMLSYVAGREAYNKAIKHYLNKHKYQNVNSDDLLMAFHETLGLSLEWFWDQWIYKGGEPAYHVSFDDITSNCKRYSVFNVSQVHTINEFCGLFKMPVIFEVHYTDGTKDSLKVWIENAHHQVKIPNPSNKEIAYVLFDPNSRIMKSILFEKPLNMLLYQAQKAPYLLDRYDAVVALRNHPLDKKIYLFKELFKTEKFHAVKNEIINQIINISDKECLELVKTALNDKDASVRKNVIQNIQKIPESLLPEFEKLLTDASYETIEISLEKLSRQFPEQLNKYLELTKNTYGTRGLNVRIKWLELAAPKNNSAMLELISYTSQSYEFITRKNAMEALQRLNFFDELLLENITHAMLSYNIRLTQPATEVLKHFYRQNNYKSIIDAFFEKCDYSTEDIQKLKRMLGA